MSSSEIKTLVTEVISKRLDSDRVRANEHTWDSAIWAELHELGVTGIDVPGAVAEDDFDTLSAALDVIEVCGYYHAQAPIVTSGFVAPWVCAVAGAPHGEGVDSVAEAKHLDIQTSHHTVISGEVIVPWGRFADRVLLIRDTGIGAQLLTINPRADTVNTTHQSNIAGEPRDRFTLTQTVATEVYTLPYSALQLQARNALGVATLMLGALEKAVDLAIEQVRVREQFGRPLSSFQVIQHHIARAVAELATVRAAVDRAVRLSQKTGIVDVSAAATAKIRAGLAVQTAVPIIHQVHGAMGVTEEHDLGLSTRRLWSWRDEGGDEHFWSRVLGREVASAAYSSTLWSILEPIEQHQ